MAYKTNTTIKSSKGASYDYCRISRKVKVLNEITGEISEQKKSFYGKSEKEAKQKYEDYKIEIDAAIEDYKKGGKNRPERRPFGEYLRWYIDNVFIPNGDIKASTKSRYINAYSSIFDGLDILSIPVGELTGERLQSVFSNTEIAASSRKAALKLLRRFYKYCSAQHITHDITGDIIIPSVESKRVNQDIIVYTEDELRAFKENTPLDHRLRFLIILAIYTGARVNELCALTYEDIDLSGESISINKGLAEIEPIRTDGEAAKTVIEITSTKTNDSIRSMPINELIIEEFKRHKKWHQAEMLQNGYRSDYLFTTSTGSLYYKSTLRKALKRLCIRLGVEPKGWHCFRHTFGSRLAEKGTPIQTVSKMMGHSDISVTSKYYINISTDEKRAALDALAL